MNSIFTKVLLLTFYCIMLTVFCGCASLQQKDRVLAVVEGEPITEGDLLYSLSIAHRKEDLSSGGAIKISEYLNKMVDDRLIIDEARRAGMDQYPEVRKAIEAYILRESVVRLYGDEIVQKVSITDEDIQDFYKKNYERFVLDFIEVTSEDKAKEILDQLKQGANFEELASKFSIHASGKEGGKVVLKRNGMSTYILDAVSRLKPGELSDVIKILNKYYIVKFISSEEAPGGEEFEKLRSSIEKTIRKQKENERSDEYLKYLRGKESIKIDKDLLESINLEEPDEVLKKWLGDKRPLVDVSGTILTVGDFVNAYLSTSIRNRQAKENIISNWIDRTVVDHEALRRHYEKEPELKRSVYRYENQLLKNTFIKRIIVPQIVITDQTLRDYYENHQKNFVSPARYKLQQITVKDEETAQEILKNLKEGADFSWVAKRRSIDSAASNGGDVGWATKSDLPEQLREIIDTTKDITPVLKIGSNYVIVNIKERTVGKIEDFNDVKASVYKECFNDQLNSILDKYIDQLKSEAKITIYDDEVKSLEAKYQK